MKKILLLLLASAGVCFATNDYNAHSPGSIGDTDVVLFETTGSTIYKASASAIKTYVLTAIPGANITNGTITSAMLSFSLATVATSGSYTDLLNKPTIPAAQINSDWNASSGLAQVLNHPVTGTQVIGSSADAVTVSGLGLGFTPSFVIVTIRKQTGNYNLFATVRGTSLSPDGFTVDLSAATETGDYHLDYLIVK